MHTFNKRLRNKFPSKHITMPNGSWIEHGVYQVEVACNPSNPIHLAIFYVGFLCKGQPGNYNQIWNPTWDSSLSCEDIYYLKPVKYLGKLFDEDIGNVGKLFRDTRRLPLESGEYTCVVDSVKDEGNGLYTMTLRLK